MIAQQMASAAPTQPPAAPPMRPQAAPPVRPGAPQGAAPQAGSDNTATRILMAAMKIIYSNPRGFVNMIRSAPSPTQGIVQATDIILKKIAQSVKGVPPQTVQALLPQYGRVLGPSIGKMLLELAMAAGIIKNPGAGAARPGQPPAPPQGAMPPAQPGMQ